MRLFQRYLSRELLQIFILSLLALLTIYALVEFFGSLDDFIEGHTGPALIFLYIVNQLPFFTVQFIPLALLLGTMLTLGSMGQHNELIALRACGISLYQISVPLIVTGLLLAGLTFTLNEYLVPPTFARARYIKRVHIRHKQEKHLLNLENVWYTGNGYIYHFRQLRPREQTIDGATIFRLDRKAGFITRRLDAAKMVFRHHEWQGYGVTIRDFGRRDGHAVLENFQSLPQTVIDITEEPADFLVPRKAVEEMNLKELRQYITRVKNVGIDVTEYRVQLYNRLFAPLICPMMVLLGIPFSLKSGRGGGMARGIGISLVIGFSFWFVLSFSLAFGKGGIVTPLAAVLLPYLLYTTAGVVMLRRQV